MKTFLLIVALFLFAGTATAGFDREAKKKEDSAEKVRAKVDAREFIMDFEVSFWGDRDYGFMYVHRDTFISCMPGDSGREMESPKDWRRVPTEDPIKNYRQGEWRDGKCEVTFTVLLPDKEHDVNGVKECWTSRCHFYWLKIDSRKNEVCVHATGIGNCEERKIFGTEETVGLKSDGTFKTNGKGRLGSIRLK